MFSRPLKEGDVLVDVKGQKFQILGVCGQVVFLEEDTYPFMRSLRELETLQYRLLEGTKPWVPKEGDRVWYFSEVGEIKSEEVYRGDSITAKAKTFPNYFRTEAETIFARDKVKELLASLKK